MTAFGFDPDDVVPGPRRPRVVASGFGGHRRGRRWLWTILVLVVALLLSARWLIGLRSSYLYYASLGHTNVFWTPFLAQVALFIAGTAIVGSLLGLNVIGWVAAARNLDVAGPRIAVIVGIVVAVIGGLIGGAYLSGQWQDVLLWINGHQFGQSDPVFHKDYSFFLFTLPILDAAQAIGWGVALVALISAVGLAVPAGGAVASPRDMPLPFSPPPGRTAVAATRVAAVHAGIALTAIFLLAAVGSHFGVYHVATSNHDTYVGLDAAERNVTRPMLGAFQVIATLFAGLTAIVVIRRRHRQAVGTAAALGGLLATWLVLVAVLETIPQAVYQGASVNPNAQTAQAATIQDFLTTSRTAWGLQSGSDVEARQFGTPTAPTPADLAADVGTLRNVRIQDVRLLPETLAQIDRSRSYQTYPTVTVDRYPTAGGGETEVMLGPREIAEANLPSNNFVNRALVYTHGYGITAVSVNRVASEGKPDVLAGQQPLRQVAADAPPDLAFGGSRLGDPRIYCGASTTQPVVVNTSRDEFDYPAAAGDATSHAGPDMAGIAVSNPVDRLALSVSDFGGLDLLLTNALTPQSRVLLHREIKDRVTSIAPFLQVDGDPYIVADPSSHHLVYIVDAYVRSDRFPESFRLPDGTSYMRNAVKAVIDAKTCQTTLYAVDPREPYTAAWNAIYPGLLAPIQQMPASLVAHLRYPEDLFQAQTQAYAIVHVSDPAVFFNRSDFYRLSDEVVDRQQQTTQAYYVELTLPGETRPRFVLLQTFSPYSTNGAGAVNMTAWLAAQSDYSASNGFHPKLVAVPLNNANNVLGPLQFDYNINTDPTISKEITLLSQSGSSVVLGNVIVLPFNNRGFLYVRPFYVLASSGSGTSFPQLRHVIVGTQNAVAEGDSFSGALQVLYGASAAKLPNLDSPGSVSATGGPMTPSPEAGASPSPGSMPAPNSLTVAENTLFNDLFGHEQAAQAALRRGDLAAFGTEEAAVNGDTERLRSLLGAASVTAVPSAPAH